MADEVQEDTGDFVDGKMVFPLRRPVQHGTDKVDAFTIREPSAGDMIAVGNPVEFDPVSSPPRIIPDMKKMADMISRLAMVPPSVVAQISTKELTDLTWKLAPFFIPV